MKVFISVDMEGCSGIVSRQETMPGGDFYREARHWMAWNANAAVEGCLEGGATEVVICESHNGLDIPWDEIHPKAKLVRFDINTSSLIQYGLESLDETFDAVFLVGHHTAYGDPRGVISHTLSRPFRDIHINGFHRVHGTRPGPLVGRYGSAELRVVRGSDKEVCINASTDQ